MARILVQDLNKHVGQEVSLQGWAFRIRRLSNVNFIVLRDRTGQIQVSLDPDLLGDAHLSTESVIEIQGSVISEPRAPGGIEVAANKIEILNAADNLPININVPELNVALDTALDHRILSLRHAKINPVFKIQSALARSFQEFLDGEGFTQIFTPKIVSGGTEGGTELFAIEYFEDKAYLAQSPQFYKQMMVGAGYERVYEIGHVYRAEKHDTSRHLNEYVSLDFEMGFIKDEQEVMDLQNRLLAYMFAYVEEKCAKELASLGIKLPKVPKIPRIPLLEAIDLLEKEYGKKHYQPDLDPEGERLLSKYFLENEGTEFVYVIDYPMSKRPMYTMPKGDGLTGSFDLLFRGLEITTGGQRIHIYDLLKENMKKKGLTPDDFTSYLDNFAHGMPPHGGLAIGLERLTQKILGLSNIREACLFPRDRNRLTP